MLIKYNYVSFYPDVSSHVTLILEGWMVIFWSDLATLAFNNGEKLEDSHSIILRLQQEIVLSVETVYPTRLIF